MYKIYLAHVMYFYVSCPFLYHAPAQENLSIFLRTDCSIGNISAINNN